MTPHQRQTKLKKLMAENGFTRAYTAKLLGVSHKTVDAWLAPKTASSHNPVGEQWIITLEAKIKEIKK